jgi:hypothetical protein
MIWTELYCQLTTIEEPLEIYLLVYENLYYQYIYAFLSEEIRY